MDSNTFTTPKAGRKPAQIVGLRKETFMVTPGGKVYGKGADGAYTLQVPYISPLAAEVRRMTGDFK